MMLRPFGVRNLRTLVLKALTVDSLTVNTSSVFPTASPTLTLTFATPGDLAVGAYSEQVCSIEKVGRFRIVRFGLGATMTHTTASGALRIAGLPEASVNEANYVAVGSLSWQGITKAGYTNIVANINSNTTVINFVASGSGVGLSSVATGDVPSGGTVILRATIIYRVS